MHTLVKRSREIESFVMESNGVKGNNSSAFHKGDSRAEEVRNLLNAVQQQLIPFIQAADDEILLHESHVQSTEPSPLIQAHSADELRALLKLQCPPEGRGDDGVIESVQSILKYSVNTFAPGFLDKLYSSANPPGLAADLILSALNTNLHVYQVSPVLTLIEKHCGKELASLFGLNGPRSGGISCQGGSASNLTSIVVARNTLFPDTKVHGNHHSGLELVLFTSVHAHYSIEKAAQACGFGSSSVISVPVDPTTGTMIPSALDHLISLAKTAGKTPFYVNATAGSTVLGSFDPFSEISAVCRKHHVWFHIDASWGGPFIFSPSQKHKLAGSEHADSIAINPHKMMAVPVTCSYLLGKDLQQFHLANTLPAGYLFHSDGDVSDSEWSEPIDQADLTLQCGRRGDSLKLFLSWQYYGTSGYADLISNAHAVASHFANLVKSNPDLILISENPPPCLQVCFYYAPNKQLVYHSHEVDSPASTSTSTSLAEDTGKKNSSITSTIVKRLIEKGFMIDFAPALEEREWMGKFFRVVVNLQTRTATIDRLIEELCAIGRQVVTEVEAVADVRDGNKDAQGGETC